jgi:hypothetical protein
MLHPIQISCISSNWRGLVVQTLIEAEEIDLVHFLFSSDVEFCEDMASKYSMDFTTNPKEHVAFFRKRRPLGFAKPNRMTTETFGRQKPEAPAELSAILK